MNCMLIILLWIGKYRDFIGSLPWPIITYTRFFPLVVGKGSRLMQVYLCRKQQVLPYGAGDCREPAEASIRDFRIILDSDHRL